MHISLIFSNFNAWLTSIESMANTYPIFADFPDHRVTGRCIYSISDLLMISLLTYLCGGEDYVDMSEFAHVRARDFNLLTTTTRPRPLTHSSV